MVVILLGASWKARPISFLRPIRFTILFVCFLVSIIPREMDAIFVRVGKNSGLEFSQILQQSL